MREVFTEWGPRHRPDIRLRLVAGLGGVGVLMANVLVLLSDRAPGFLRFIFGRPARRFFAKFDLANPRDLTGGQVLPESDFIAHVGIWALAVVFSGLALWRWRGLLVVAVTMMFCSVVLEVAQGRYSRTRAVERNDLIANAGGVIVGAIAVAACYLVWSGLARRFDFFAAKAPETGASAS